LQKTSGGEHLKEKAIPQLPFAAELHDFRCQVFLLYAESVILAQQLRISRLSQKQDGALDSDPIG
jgi:hypothetical protein